MTAETPASAPETPGEHELDGELERLVDSLLYEGYALYPYTPGAQKNATPTPFGIVYPPAYAARNPATFDRARLQCLARPAAGAQLSVTVWFLRPSGERHEAERHCVEVGPTQLGERVTVPFAQGRVTLRSEPVVRAGDRDEAGDGDLGGAGQGLWKVSSCVHNTSAADPGPERAAALGESLISTHIVVRISAGSFVSPLESEGCESVNTWPVLATPADDAILGAAIVLPDHPRLAPESLGNLFDNTEIEEALFAARARAERLRARADLRTGPGGAGDGRARGRGDAAGDAGVARTDDAERPLPRPRSSARAAARRHRRSAGRADADHGGGRRVQPWRAGGAAARRARRPLRPDARRSHRQDPSASGWTWTTVCTSPSASTTTRCTKCSGRPGVS